jgi:hypothetical protein
MLIILSLDSVNKLSPMSEGVTKIPINSQPCKGIDLTTRRMWARRAPRVVTVHDMVKETIRALLHIFHVYASVDKPWVAHALSYCTPVRYGRIDSISMTYDATKFWGFHMSCMHQYIQVLVHSNHCPSFPFSILPFPLIAPPSL